MNFVHVSPVKGDPDTYFVTEGQVAYGFKPVTLNAMWLPSRALVCGGFSAGTFLGSVDCGTPLVDRDTDYMIHLIHCCGAKGGKISLKYLAANTENKFGRIANEKAIEFIEKIAKEIKLEKIQHRLFETPGFVTLDPKGVIRKKELPEPPRWPGRRDTRTRPPVLISGVLTAS